MKHHFDHSWGHGAVMAVSWKSKFITYCNYILCHRSHRSHSKRYYIKKKTMKTVTQSFLLYSDFGRKSTTSMTAMNLTIISIGCIASWLRACHDNYDIGDLFHIIYHLPLKRAGPLCHAPQRLHSGRSVRPLKLSKNYGRWNRYEKTWKFQQKRGFEGVFPVRYPASRNGKPECDFYCRRPEI